MSFYKNKAGQKVRVFAFNRTTNQPVTGDAANITCKVAKDWGSATALGDTNPAEVEDGFYLFDLTQAETDAEVLDFYPESSTSDVMVIATPGTLHPEDELGVTSDVNTGTVTPTTTTFAGQDADLSATDDLYSSGGGMLVVFTSGALKGVPRPVVDYGGTDRQLTVSPAFPAAPSSGDTFVLIGRP